MGSVICSTAPRPTKDVVPSLQELWLEDRIGCLPCEVRTTMDCSSREFCRGIVHVEAPTVLSHTVDYCEFVQKVVHRHPKTRVMSILTCHSRAVLLADPCTCFTHITHIQNRQAEDAERLSDLLECFVRLRMVPWRRFLKEGVEYVAVKNSDLLEIVLEGNEMLSITRRYLTEKHCVFNYTVAYGTATARSVLFPCSLIRTDAIAGGDVVVACLTPFEHCVHDGVGLDAAQFEYACIMSRRHDSFTVHKRSHSYEVHVHRIRSHVVLVFH